jgi:DUF1680 family protein
MLGFLVLPMNAWPMSSGPVEPAKLEAVAFTDVQITGGFWADRMKTNRDVTVRYCFDMCEQTGRISNFAKAAGLMDGDFEGIYFNDSDVYKVIEGAAYSLSIHPDPELEAYVDGVIDKIAAAQWEDGYLYTHYSVPNRQPEKRWTNIRDMHELYCAGHFFEAAAAYYQATGKRKILDVAVKLADYIDSVFGEDGKIDVPGHQEIEIGLVKLYRVTGREKYLRLAKSFLDWRGRKDLREIFGAYCQDHAPVLEQTRAVGHAVRAGYMYCGMADVAALAGDEGYIKAIDTIWENVVSKRQYITGGVGARHGGESFGEDYELPNASAYNETCAAIANAMWNHRLFLLHGDAKYIDVLERVIYNGFLSGISLEGNKFFYPNPLECQGSYLRSGWFGCSCCPVNVVRFVPSIAGYVYAKDGDSVYVNLYIGGSGQIKVGKTNVRLTQHTRYPWEGLVKIAVELADTREFELRLRIPGWSQETPFPSDLYRYVNHGKENIALKVNDKAIDLVIDDGFATIRRKWHSGDVIELNLPMSIRRVMAHDNVKDDIGKVALQRGPIVYCAESVDNAGHVRNLVLGDNAVLEAQYRSDLLNGVVVIKGKAKGLEYGDNGALIEKSRQFQAIPYYAWAHRGAGPMSVWLGRTVEAARALPAPTIASESKVSTSYQSHLDNAQLSGVNNQIEPRDSGDEENNFFHWWPHLGTQEWLQYDFKEAVTVSSVEVYWFDDTGRGACRVPKSWRVSYGCDGQWKPVAQSSGYGVEKDKFNKVTFEAVKTDALRLEIQFEEGFSGGVLEWKVL